MKLVTPLGDGAMEQFLKTASITAELDRRLGRDIVSRRFVNRITHLNNVFSATYKQLTDVLEERRRLVAERTEAVRQLARVYRAVRTSLKRQGALGLIPETVLARFQLKVPPTPTKMEAWITRGEKMLAAFAESAAEGRAPITVPSPDLLRPAVEEAERATTALNAKRGELKEIRDRIKEHRAAVKLLHGAVSLHIRANLRGEPTATVRDVMRRYGYLFTGKQEEPTTDEAPTTAPAERPSEAEPTREDHPPEGAVEPTRED
nr:hypothetical protein [Acidobacteriota bacterium]